MSSSYPLKFPLEVLSGPSLEKIQTLSGEIQTKILQTIQGAKLQPNDELGAVIMKLRTSLSYLHRLQTGFQIIEVGNTDENTIILLLVDKGDGQSVELSLDEIKDVALCCG